MAIDYTTPAGQVRLLIADTDEANPILTPDQIDAFLSLEGDEVFCAAALALETIAVDQALVLKVIRTLDVSTDGAKVAAELRARAAELRQRATDDADSADDDFAIAEFADPVFGYRDRMRRQILRDRA